MNGPMATVGTAVRVNCFPGRSTEDWTSAAARILQMNARIFVSYIRTRMYLK